MSFNYLFNRKIPNPTVRLRQGYIREGKSYLCLGDYSSALRTFQKVKELEPTNTAIEIDVRRFETPISAVH